MKFEDLSSEDDIDPLLQIDSARMSGLNEVLAVYLMAAKLGKRKSVK